MSEALQAQVKATPATQLLTAARAGMLQRKCGCGSSASVSGPCQQCKVKEKPLQRYSNSRTADSLLGLLFDSSHPPPPEGLQRISALNHSFGKVKVHNRTLQKLQPKLSISSPTDQHEQEADRAAELITGASPHSADPTAHLSPPLSSAQSVVQRSPTPEAEAGEQTSPAGLIVEDDAAQLASAQMRKTQFLDQLQSEVCNAADAELASVGRSTEGCPYIEKWIGHYRSRPPQYVERSLRKYAPEATGATSARDYIPLVAQRVRRAVSVWAKTGEITGVPDELAGQLPSAGLLGAAEGLLSGIGGAISDAIGSAGAAIGSIFTKAKEGGPRLADDPQQIQAQLNDGQTLDGGVKSRMEAAYRHDFSRVRVHTGSQAESLSNDMNARAFTIGSNIAFAAGEYRPGTLVGDALIAHELAHVVQQGGAVSSDGPMHKGATDYNHLEEDADRSAVGAVASLWGGGKGTLKEISQNAMPRLTSGLRLSRCKAETCSQGNKNVTVDLIRMRGATGTPASDLAEANKIYQKCCVQFTKVKDETVPNDPPKKLSDTWLGGDTDLNASGITCSAVTAEEKSMYDGATTAYSLSSRMRAFYVQSFSGYAALGFSRPPYCAAGYPNHVILQNGTNRTDLAHEFGHILLNSPDHPDDKNNLMHGTNDRNTEIDDSQCKTIYNNA